MKVNIYCHHMKERNCRGKERDVFYCSPGGTSNITDGNNFGEALYMAHDLVACLLYEEENYFDLFKGKDNPTDNFLFFLSLFYDAKLGWDDRKEFEANYIGSTSFPIHVSYDSDKWKRNFAYFTNPSIDPVSIRGNRRYKSLREAFCISHGVGEFKWEKLVPDWGKVS